MVFSWYLPCTCLVKISRYKSAGFCILSSCVARGHAENAHDHGQKRQIYAWALAWAALMCGRLYE